MGCRCVKIGTIEGARQDWEFLAPIIRKLLFIWYHVLHITYSHFPCFNWCKYSTCTGGGYIHIYIICSNGWYVLCTCTPRQCPWLCYNYIQSCLHVKIINAEVSVRSWVVGSWLLIRLLPHTSHYKQLTSSVNHTRLSKHFISLHFTSVHKLWWGRDSLCY